MTAVTFRVVTYSDALDPDSTEIENVTFTSFILEIPQGLSYDAKENLLRDHHTSFLCPG